MDKFMKLMTPNLADSQTHARLLSAERLVDMLDYRLYLVYRDCGYWMTRLLQTKFGLTRRRWRILATVYELEGATLSEIAEGAELDRAQASRSVGTMVREGYLKRLSHPDNARYAKVIFTEKGRALYQDILCHYQGGNRRLLEALTEDEIETLDTVIDKLRDHAQKLISE